jgi:hypothetical protein
MGLLQFLKGAWGTFADFAASSLGGFILGQIGASADMADWDEFEAKVEEVGGQGEHVLENLIGVDVTPPGEMAQAIGDMGFGPEPDPTAVDIAQDVYAEGTALGSEFFDPTEAVARYQETFQGISEGFQGLPDEIAALNQNVSDLYGEARTGFEAGYGALMGDYEDWWGGARELVAGLGEWERGDINRRYNEAGIEQQMQLGARGLGATGLASIAGGIERERSGDLLRLQEQIARQQLGVEMDFGGAMLGAQERGMGASLNLYGAEAAAMQGGNQLWGNAAMNALMAQANIAGGEFGAFNTAAANRLSNMYTAAGYPINTQLAAGQQALNWFQNEPMVMPQAGSGPDLYPYGGF